MGFSKTGRRAISGKLWPSKTPSVMAVSTQKVRLENSFFKVEAVGNVRQELAWRTFVNIYYKVSDNDPK